LRRGELDLLFFRDLSAFDRLQAFFSEAFQALFYVQSFKNNRARIMLSAALVAMEAQSRRPSHVRLSEGSEHAS
jgi:hypothetical protein